MKTISLLFLFVAITFSGYSQGLENIIVERYYVSNADDSIGSVGTLPVGSVTYRIFVDMVPGYKFQAAYGNSVHTLSFATTTAFFNNEDRGAKTPSYNKNQAKSNSVSLDSWVSAGAACAGNQGVLKSEDDGIATLINTDGMLQNDDTLAGIPLSTQDGLLAGTPPTITMVGIDSDLEVLNDLSQAGNLFTTTNGAWSCLNGSKGPTTTNRVLIAQLTTKGVFNFHINLQIKDTVNNVVERYVSENPQPDEILFAGLNYSSNLSPSVSISSPSNGTSFISGISIPIQSVATDIDGIVKKVNFYVDGNLIGSDSTLPYELGYTGVYGNHTLLCAAIDDFSDTTFSAPVSINVGEVGTIENTNNSATIKFYPNPFDNYLSIEVNSTETNASLTCRIYEMNGRLVSVQSLEHMQGLTLKGFDLSFLTAGQYLVECTLGHKVISQVITKR